MSVITVVITHLVACLDRGHDPSRPGALIVQLAKELGRTMMKGRAGIGQRFGAVAGPLAAAVLEPAAVGQGLSSEEAAHRRAGLW
jgi:hypothetical protein